jgi:L-iditol 2-dehydrogenase
MINWPNLTGCCSSDIHFWKTGAIGSLKVEGDCILGHEAAGIVLKCGDGVTNLKPGKLEQIH